MTSLPVLLALAHWLQASLIALAVGLILARAEAGSARFRSRIAAAGFYGAALLPLAAWLPQGLSLSVGPGGAPVLDVAAPIVAASAALPARFASLALAIALLGALARLVQTMRAARRGGAMAARARPIDGSPYGLPAGTRLAVSREVAGPAVAGILRPAILIPAALLELPTDELARLLRHERGHVERGDLARALFQRIIEDLYWWNPAMARLGNHIREAREFACDEYAAQDEAQGFARSLLREARRRLAPPPAALALGATDPHGLERRIDRLTTPGRPALALRSAALALAMFAAMLVAPRAPQSGHTHVGVATSSGLYKLSDRLAQYR